MLLPICVRNRVCRVSVWAFLVAFVAGSIWGGWRSSGGGVAAAAKADARKRLSRVISKGDEDAVKSLLKKMASAGGKQNARAILRILPKVPPKKEGLYWQLIAGICSFRDAIALEAIGATILDHVASPLSRDLLFGLSGNSSPDLLVALDPPPAVN